MKITGTVAGISFANKAEGFDKIRPVGNVDLIRETDNEYDPNAIRVMYQGIKLGYIKMNSYMQEFLVENPHIKTASVEGYSYGSGDGTSFNDDHIGVLSSVRIIVEDTTNTEDINKVFNEDGCYVINGVAYDRVTKVLSNYNFDDPKYLYKWMLTEYKSFDEYQRGLKESSAAGTAMHKKLEFAMKNWNDPNRQLDHNDPVIKSLMSFVTKVGPSFRPLSVEHTFRNDEHKFAGTCDLVFEYRDKQKKRIRAALDWKSNKKATEKNKVQASVYATELQCDESFVVSFGANTAQGFSICKVKDIDRQYNRFIKLLELSRM